MNLLTKLNRLRDIENKLMVTKRERGWERAKLETREYPIQTAMYKIDRVLLSSTGNYIQYLIITYNEKEYTHTHTHTYIDSQFCPSQRYLVKSGNLAKSGDIFGYYNQAEE